jgi:hypothetical protein
MIYIAAEILPAATPASPASPSPVSATSATSADPNASQEAQTTVAVTNVSLPVDTSEALTLAVVDAVCLQVTYKNQTITLDPRLLLETPDMAVGYAGLESSIELVWDSERFNSRGAASSVAERKGVRDLTQHLFIVGFDGGDIHFITRKQIQPLAVNIAGITLSSIVKDDLNYMRPRQWMASHTRGLQTLIIRNKAKRPLLAQIKPEDSIAALEKQLDLVTQLVITLSASLPAAQVPNWLAALTTMMSQSSATQFMGDDAAVSDIAATKAVIRKLQTTYFNLRQVTP